MARCLVGQTGAGSHRCSPEAEGGNLGDSASVGGEISEMRVHFGPGYRLYFTRRGGLLVILLVGGDKSTQSRDIKRAQRIATELGADP